MEVLSGDISFHLRPLPPFRLDLTVWALRRRPHNRMDRWDGGSYRRVLLIQDRPVEVAVAQKGSAEAPQLLVQAIGLGNIREQSACLTAKLERLLGFNADLREFYAFCAREARLHQLVQQFRGVKPPRFPTMFEALINGIACQQLSLTAGIHLLNRLTASFGPAFPGEPEPAAAFPRPQDLAGATPEALRALGFNFSKARAIIELAGSLASGGVDLEQLATRRDEEVSDYLQSFRGIGRWTAEYALLRGLGRWQVFPGDDVGARRNLQGWLELPEPLDYQGVRRLMARWRPFAGLIYFHLLLGRLAEEGHLS